MKDYGFRVWRPSPRVVASKASPARPPVSAPSRAAPAVAGERERREAVRAQRHERDRKITQARELDDRVGYFVREIRNVAAHAESLLQEVNRLEIELKRIQRENAPLCEQYATFLATREFVCTKIRDCKTRLHLLYDSMNVARDSLRSTLGSSASLWAAIPSALRKRRRESGAATRARQAQALLKEQSS